jgi:hypothetical protein
MQRFSRSLPLRPSCLSIPAFPPSALILLSTPSCLTAMINTTTLAMLAAGNSTGGGSSVKGAPSAAQAAKAAIKARQLDYPRNFAFFLVGVIGVCTLVHWTSKALSMLYRPTRRRSATLADPEGGNQSRRHTSVFRRLVAAALSTIRIIAFRIPVPIGLGRFLLGSEVAFAVVYLVAVWTWTLADSEHIYLSLFLLLRLIQRTDCNSLPSEYGLPVPAARPF